MDNRDEFEAWYRENSFEYSAISKGECFHIWNAASAPQWRPIAEAPKDGTVILLLDADHSCPSVYAGKWAPDDICDWMFIGQDNELNGFLRRYPPTHFMPLPQPPENV